MPYRKQTNHLTARDGTKIAWHTHLEPGGHLDDEPLFPRPTALLTNGIGTSENFWRFLVEGLGDRHRVVHWDYRGHGASELSSVGDYSIATQADDLRRVTLAAMERAGTKTPPVHVAFSMGVAVLLELYRTNPELVPAMVLIAGSPEAPFSTLGPLRSNRVRTKVREVMQAATPAVPLFAPVAKALMSSPFVYPVGRVTGMIRKRAPKEDIATFFNALAAMDLVAYWKTAIGLMGANASDVLPNVKVPVQIIAAANDLLMPLDQVRRLRNQLPNAQYLEVKDAGHAGLLEAGSEISSAVKAFVAQHAES